MSGIKNAELYYSSKKLDEELVMIKAKLKVTLVLMGPILTKSTAIGAPGIDAPVARTGEKRTCYIPDSLVKGKLREAWAVLNKVIDNRFDISLLGEDSDKSGKGYEPFISKLSFSDFLYTGENESKQKLKYRIQIDPDRGSVKKNSMMVIERPFAPGEKYSFAGEIGIMAENDSKAKQIADDVEMGLRWITSFGSERTVGFGRLDDVETHYETVSENILLSDSSPKPIQGLRLTINKPFCISKRRTIDNVFESESILSGAVLRGAIASTIKPLVGLTPTQDIDESSLPEKWRMLGKYFNRIAYSHAFPVMKDNPQRPVVPPNSLVKVGNDETYYDIALNKGPFLLMSNPKAPAFQIDWKDHSKVITDFGWNEPGHELRVRTRIDSDKRKALKGQLFAYDMIVTDKHQWLSRINFDRIPAEDRSQVEAQLKELFAFGIHNIGKTKAKAEVTIDNSFTSLMESNASPINNQWVITLQTPALLCDPAILDEESGVSELYQAYEKVWQDISGGTLTLLQDQYFARQSLSGRYLIKRFQGSKPYNPFLLTDAGSVFVLQASGNSNNARLCIEKWLKGGLDLPRWAKDRYREDWRTNPYLPEDGFGEIAVNLGCHLGRQPRAEEVVYVK